MYVQNEHTLSWIVGIPQALDLAKILHSAGCIQHNLPTNTSDLYQRNFNVSINIVKYMKITHKRVQIFARLMLKNGCRTHFWVFFFLVWLYVDWSLSWECSNKCMILMCHPLCVNTTIRFHIIVLMEGNQYVLVV